MTIIRFSLSGRPASSRLYVPACAVGVMALLSGVSALAATTPPSTTARHKHHHHHAHAQAETASPAHGKAGHKAKPKSKAHAAAEPAHKAGAHKKKHPHAVATAHHHAAPAPAVAAAGVAAAGAGAVAAGAAPATAPDAAAPGVAPPDLSKGTVTGLPLPRYASLRADEVNMRAGPGRRFPILWVYHRRGLPMRVEREFDVWRLVEDQSGQKGWVQQATLAGGRDFLVPGEPPGNEAPIPVKSDQNGDRVGGSGHMDSREEGTVATPDEAARVSGAVLLRAGAGNDSGIVAVLKPGTVGSIKECPAGSGWCRVSVRQYGGWVPRQAIWGVDAQETIGPS
ncbi:MAG: SH3 domain-containing protein [Acetobacter sp.]